MTVRQAVLEIYNEMPVVFDGLVLIERVREKLGRPLIFDGTITRELRALRKAKTISYSVLSKKESKYLKTGGVL